jgi:2-C-methyl-D-erythritol 4-phosphate cytidylyltransferase
MNKTLSVVIVAAGASTRISGKTPKPFIKINNKPILWYSAFLFNKLDFVKEIYIVISKKNLIDAKRIQKKYLKNINKFKNFIIGGKERSDSVYNALQYIYTKNKPDYIAIHDAARPLIRTELTQSIFNEAIKYEAAAPGIPITDTIKECNNSFISSHLNRKNLIAIQTPQIFNFNKLINSYNKYYNKNMKITDDTEIYSKKNKNVKIVEGDINLFKITYKRDIKIAKKIIKKHKKLWK